MKPFPHTSLTAFSRNLRRLRTAAGLSQEDTAEKLDIHSRHYQKLESGTVTPTFGVLVRLRRVFRCSWEKILKGA